MENALYIALSRRRSLERQMDIVSNNLANMNTPAYKAERLVFQEYLVEAQKRAPGLSYVQDFGQYRAMEEGPLQRTGNTFDVAISGDGYFTIDTPLGERYTRHGRFELNPNGELVNSSGNLVLGDAGPIVVPPGTTDIEIARDGTISGSNGRIGRLQLVTFDDLTQLRRAADGMYTSTQEPQAVDNPRMVQGSIEGSNVQAILELTNMMQIANQHSRMKTFIDKEDQRQRNMIDKLTQTSA